MRIARNLLISSSALILAGTMAACAQMPAAQNASAGTMTSSYHPNSIQPETTLDISAQATVKKAPDIAYINAGVQAEAETAQQAMADQAKAMNSMFEALAAAGIPDKDMQTSNLSLNPVYDYVEETDKNGRRSGKQVLRGYTASNQLTVKVSDLDNLGETLDSLVAAGGNTFNGLSFALEDPSDAQDEARREAIKDAVSRAQLYAEAAGMRVGRIVSISESGGHAPQPVQMGRMVMNEAMEAKATPISGGEIGYSAQVSVTFELVK